ncbi:MAG TPA: DUF5985 family protein [Fimbriimonadaceae bacterium]|nr:DUF5985 family protein [Fimbriimonadaceae bacterium]
MAATIYVLCFATSLGCAILLFRGYRRSKVRLLLWSGFCFTGFAFNNALLFVDRILLPTIDLFWLRSAPTVAGLALLLYGFIWEGQ